MAEEVLIKIELEKGDNERQVDAMTRKITELQEATANLQKQNNELIKSGKQNSQEYVENTRQIELNKQKINEAVATRKGLIQTLTAEENSIKSLRVRNAELIKQRDLLSTSTEAGRKKIAEINAELDKNNAIIKDNVSAQEKQRLGVGGYADALDKLVPGLGATINGIQGATKAALLFIATPLGLALAVIALALAAVSSYFKRTEEGGDELNKVMFITEAILGKVGDAAAVVGEFLVDAFNNPKQALIDFGNFLLSQIFNRFTGLLELIPKLGEAISLLFEGKFTAAGKVAGDAVGKVVLGIENATDKVIAFADSISEAVDIAIAQGNRLSELDKSLGDQEEALTVQRQRTALETAKIRERALTQESEAKKKTILEAIALEEQLSQAETRFAKTRLEQALIQQQIDGVTGESKQKVADAQAAVFAAEATAFANTLRFRKELAAIDEATAKEQAALLAEANEMLDKQLEEELKRKEREREAMILTEELRLEQEALRAQTIEERVEKEIELELYKAQTLLENDTLVEAERQLILEKSQAAINAIIVKGNTDRRKQDLDAEKKLADEKKKLRDAEVRGIDASLDAAVSLGKQAFGENKAIAIAETVVNTVRGIVRAIADYPFPYSLIVSALVGAIGTVQTAKIAGIKFARGGIARTGGMLRGASHARGGIPFTVQGQGGFEAEGGEAIINKRSTKMFRPLLSSINQAGGGLAFASGGRIPFASGNVISGSQTRQASAQAESRTAARDAVASMMANLPPIIVTVEDINARSEEVSSQTEKAMVI